MYWQQFGLGRIASNAGAPMRFWSLVFALAIVSDYRYGDGLIGLRQYG
jgi:hypothetical protein